MATIETIGTNARDYSTIQAWEDAVPATPTNGYEGHCYNDSEFTGGVDIDGHTTSSTDYILLTAASGQSFQDHADVRTNALIYDQSKGVGVSANPFAATVFEINDANASVTRLQIKRSGSSYNTAVAEGGSTLANVVYKDCILQKAQNDSGSILVLRSSNEAYNCALIDAGGGSTTGLSITSGTAKNITVVRSSALAAGGTGVEGGYSALVENIACFGFSTAFSGSFSASSGYNGTDAATAPGSNNQTSLTYADQFESTTGDFRLKTGSSLIDAGNTDATNAPNDISGTARGTGLDGDIGAWEFVAAGGGTELEVDDAAHSHTADNVALTQSNVLAVQDASHGHVADSPPLVQAHVLDADDALHAHSAESPALTQAHVLVVQDAQHDHAAGNIVLTQAHALAVADAAHAHTADSVVLSTGTLLAVADALHSHAVENVALTQAHVLTVAGALHAHAAANVVLVQAHVLAVQDATHAHAAESPTLSLADILAVADSIHVHTADEIALTQSHVLVVSDALHSHLADLLTLQVPSDVPPSRRVFRVEAASRTFVVVRGNRTFQA